MPNVLSSNTTLDNGLEHRVGAKLHDYEYNDTIDKEDLVPNIHRIIDGLYTSSLDKQRAACGIRRVGGLMSDFKCNTNTNVFYGFSSTSYVLKFPLKNINFFNSLFVRRMHRHSGGYERTMSSSNINSAKHRKFFSISDVYMTPYGTGTNTSTGHFYGYKNESDTVKTKWTEPDGVTPVDPPTVDYNRIMFNIEDTANRPDIFSHRLLFFINGMMFTDLMIYTVPDYIIMVIDADRSGISLDKITEYTDPTKSYRWTMLGIPFGNCYATDPAGELMSIEVVPDTNTIGLKLGSFAEVDTLKWRNGEEKDRKRKSISYNIDRKTDAQRNFNVKAGYSDPSTCYLCGYATDASTGSTNRHNTGLMHMSLNTPMVKSTSVIQTTGDPDTEGFYPCTDTINGDYYLRCFDITQLNQSTNVYEFMGNYAYEKFNRPAAYKDMHIVELKNVAAIIPLGINRIFKVGCSETIPGPVPPENILIFKYESRDGLSLVHMVSSDYMNSNGEISKYDRVAIDKERPNKAMIPFKPADESTDVYDYPKFIPVRDKYDVEPDVEQQKYIDLYYPNVFNLVGFSPNDNLIAVVFYDKGCNNAFVNPLEKFMQFDTNYANNIVSGNVPTVISDYIPAINRYTEDLYINGYHTKATRAIEYQFKLESLRELVNDDGNRLVDIYDRKYNKDKNKFNNSVKYILDFTTNKADAPDVKYRIPHIYKDQLVQPEIVEGLEIVRVYSAHGYTDHPVRSGLRVYKSASGRNLIHLSDMDDNGDRFDETDSGFTPIEISNLITVDAPSVRLHMDPMPKTIYTVSTSITTVRVDSYYGPSVIHPVTTIKLYKSVDLDPNTNKPYTLINPFDTDDNGDQFLPDAEGYVRVTQSGSMLIIPDEGSRSYDVPIHAYTFTINSKEEIDTPYPVSVWVDGERLSTDMYYTSHTAFTSSVSIFSEAVKNKSYVELEIYKLRHKDAYYKELKLPGIHNSKSIKDNANEEVWEELSPQNTLVAVAREVIIDGQDATKYIVPSSYEMYWLLIGHTQYIDGIPVNIPIDERAAAHIYQYHVIKSMQARINQETGEVEHDEVVLLADEDTALIGETDEAFAGNVDLLKTFGNKEYYKTIQERNPELNEYVLMLREGYYGRDRRRFFEYLPMGKNDPMVYITPITNYFAGKDVLVKNLNVYFEETHVLETDPQTQILSNKITIRDFQFDPSPDKFRLYLNGKLLDYGYDYITSVNLEHNDFGLGDNFDIFILANLPRTGIMRVLFEYLPYRYELIQRSVEKDGVIILSDELLRPYDPRNFDIYVDGDLLKEEDIIVYTERRIGIRPIIDKIELEGSANSIVAIYEKAHDTDVFDKVWRNNQVSINYLDHAEPIITVDDKVWYGKIKHVEICTRETIGPVVYDDVHEVNGIYVYFDENGDMALDLTTEDVNGDPLDSNVIDPAHYANARFKVVDEVTDKTTLQIRSPWIISATTPRKVQKENVKRKPEDPEQFLTVKLGQKIKYSLDEQLMRTNADYRQTRTPTYSVSHSSLMD